MARCDYCSDKLDSLPFKCKYCGGTFCNKHRLPENHKCAFDLKHTPVVPAIPRGAPPITPPQTIDKLRPASDFENPKQLQKYLERQQKNRKKAQKIYQRSIRQTRGMGGEVKATTVIIALILIVSITAFILYYSGLEEYIYLSIYGLLRYYFWTIPTSLFIFSIGDYLGFFFLFIFVLFIYNMSINLELRFGRMFIIRLYLTCTLITAIFYLLIRLSLITLFPINGFNIIPYGLASGAILGIISFISFLFYDTEMTMLCMFIPVRMKGRTILLFLIIYTVIISLLFGIIHLADLGGIFAAYLVHRNYTQR